MPFEILYNIFGALERNEIEKCQLINKRWRDTVDANNSRLPKRIVNFLRLGYDEEGDNEEWEIYFRIKENDDYTNLSKMSIEERKRSYELLKECVFETFYISLLDTKAMEVMEDLVYGELENF